MNSRKTCRAITLLMSFALVAATHAEPALRVVSTDAAATELLFALERDPLLVAVDVTSQLPTGYRRLPNVGYHRNLSSEGLLALTPDLVVGSEHIGPPTVLSSLRQAGVQVLTLPAASSIDMLRNNLQQLAAAIGSDALSEKIAAKLEDSRQQLMTSRLKGQRIGLVLTMNNKLRLAGSGTGGDAFIQLLGGSNIAAFDNYRDVAAESLLMLQPDLLLVVGADPHSALDDLRRSHSSAALNGLTLRAVDGRLLVAGLSLGAVDAAVALATPQQTSGGTP